MDEVGELPLDTQVKLLRVLQEQEFERLGGVRPIKVDVRLVAATNRDLEVGGRGGAVPRGPLSTGSTSFPIRIPPLRERPDDIPLLVRHFLAHFQRKLAKPLRGVTPRRDATAHGVSVAGQHPRAAERARASVRAGARADRRRRRPRSVRADRPVPDAIPVVDDAS